MTTVKKNVAMRGWLFKVEQVYQPERRIEIKTNEVPRPIPKDTPGRIDGLRLAQ
jgi:hypothetical protein